MDNHSTTGVVVTAAWAREVDDWYKETGESTVKSCWWKSVGREADEEECLSILLASFLKGRNVVKLTSFGKKNYEGAQTREVYIGIQLGWFVDPPLSVVEIGVQVEGLVGYSVAVEFYCYTAASLLDVDGGFAPVIDVVDFLAASSSP